MADTAQKDQNPKNVTAVSGQEPVVKIVPGAGEPKVVFHAGSPQEPDVVVHSGELGQPTTSPQVSTSTPTSMAPPLQAKTPSTATTPQAAPATATPQPQKADAAITATPPSVKPVTDGANAIAQAAIGAATPITVTQLPPARPRGATIKDLKDANAKTEIDLAKSSDGPQHLKFYNAPEGKDSNSVVIRYGDGSGFMVTAADPVDPKTGKVYLHAPAGHDPNLSVDDVKGLDAAFEHGGATGVLNYASAHHLCITSLPKADVVHRARIVGGHKPHHRHGLKHGHAAANVGQTRRNPLGAAAPAAGAPH